MSRTLSPASPFPLIHAVLEGSQPGSVFGNPDDPASAAFVLTRFGFAQWVGDERRTALDGTIEHLLAGGDPGLPHYWLWYAPPGRWAHRLDAQPRDRVRRRERCRFVLAGSPPPTRARVDGAVQIRLMDARLLADASPLGLDLESRFWRSSADLLEKGVAVCAVQDGRVISLCYAACVAGGLAEVDIATLPEHGGRGLARAAAERFIEEALARGIRPTWDCFTENTPSMRLAQALGFTRERLYPMYSFNTPLDIGPGDLAVNEGDRR